MRGAWVIGALLLAPVCASHANDGAAEVGAGGIQLRDERRVAMRKERLFISLEKVKVEYEFVNESTSDVVTTVAFPIPEYSYNPVYDRAAQFTDFKVWVNEKPISVTREVRAFLGERDVTQLLVGMGLDVASLARVDDWGDQGIPDGYEERQSPLAQIPRLPPEQIARLRQEKVLGWGNDDELDGNTPEERLWPRWTVRITYHWEQRFPAGATVRVRHEYQPVIGMSNGPATENACVDEALRKALKPPPGQWGWFQSEWVKYILTTANTWKTPIRDFELLIEYPERRLVSLCWDGKITKAGPRLFRSVMKDFVPKRELEIFFYQRMW
jgi:hypothetical protein